ncbi:MAG: hypothetical protein HQL87_15765 [Magnetococcales bacterium]|nr:hypothetical protein [Magnetococcales bacterium]
MREILASIADRHPPDHPAAMASDPVADPATWSDSCRETLQPALVELARRLTRFSVGSTAAFNAVKPILLRAGLSQEVEQMTGQMDRFRYAEARISLATIAQKLAIAL